MQQYLLNTSAIWFISLLMFDLFLRRESYHSYNRFYLISTFLLGALLPIWQWQGTANISKSALQLPVEKVIAAKQTIINASTSAGDFDWAFWLRVIYTAGALVAVLLLFIDISRMIVFYRNGRKSKQNDWTVIETGKEHAPFSFLNILFVCSMGRYSQGDWEMVLTHERRHKTLVHFADLVLMQVGRIIFWFHPLVYVYDKRLLLVHEYQADSAASDQPKQYGSFLIEQALLSPAPNLSHSFNRSPIKKRIIMLTRRSSLLANTKMLVFVPVALVCLFCFSKNSLSQRFVRKGNIVTYRGNTFELSKKENDTVTLVDPVTAEEVTKVVQYDPRPIKMNGKPLPWDADQPPLYTGSDQNLRDYLVRNMKNELSKLKDGQYRFNVEEILIDENGKIVYFNYNNIQRSKTADEVRTPTKSVVQVTNASDPRVTIKVNTPDGKTMTLNKNTNPAFFEDVDPNLQQEIFNKVCDLMEAAPGFTPAKLDGKNVVGKYDCFRFYNHFKVLNHKVYDMDKSGGFKEL